jgi:hypothetical protein
MGRVAAPGSGAIEHEPILRDKDLEDSYQDDFLACRKILADIRDHFHFMI